MLLQKAGGLKMQNTEPLPPRYQLWKRLREMGLSPAEKLAILSPLRDKPFPEKERIALEIMKQMDRTAGGQR